MRFMAILKATAASEAGTLPRTEDIAAVLAFNEELVKAGILLAADGLKPSSAGARVRFSGSERTVIDGPFAEPKELVAGYWILEVASLEEASSGSSAARTRRRTRSGRSRSGSSPRPTTSAKR